MRTFRPLYINCLLLVFVMMQALALQHALAHDIAGHADDALCNICEYHGASQPLTMAIATTPAMVAVLAMDAPTHYVPHLPASIIQPYSARAPPPYT